MTMLEKCQAEFALLTGVNYDDTNVAMKAIVEDMAIFKENQKENLGISSLSLNGISEAYSSDYPISILRALDKFRKRVYFV